MWGGWLWLIVWSARWVEVLKWRDQKSQRDFFFLSSPEYSKGGKEVTLREADVQNIAICGTVDNATSLGRQNVPGHFFFGIFGCTLSKVYRLRQNNLMRGYCNVGSHPASTRSHSACNVLQKCICCKVWNPSSTLSRSLLYLLASFNITESSEGKKYLQRI